MAPPDLSPLKQPIAIRPEHIATSPTRLRVKQRDNALHSGDFSISKEETSFSGGANNAGASTEAPQPSKLFTVDGKLLSVSQRRIFYDASSLPLFEVCRKALGTTWYVQVPGAGRDGADLRLAELAPRFSAFKDNLDLYVRNAAADGEDAFLEVRGQDIWKLRTNVYVDGKPVMTVKRTDKLAVYVLGKHLEWVVDVAEGMDLSLASAIVVVMAATMYDSNITMPVSRSAGKSGGG
ncbi:uncharacterized protein K452DRAFT_297342 [Aplosporella prunicola CBS 121167]|uniref:Tubby C-terminal domain-containing protein n=1 Tax=Aplosporella prunicola CBS 121167 TaxID=1176127 RepID=A0A6A6BF66_9PEZI|nr:uncharacterized protein K452DRAFT_297342 [Aplosporella prunicola CBS 121167]KAF2142810.1 hypothetical protein K452DRAFT_297342 [Aplosporella prunicola CBS 121167]